MVSMLVAGRDAVVDRALEEMLGRQLPARQLDVKLGNSMPRDTHLKTAKGEELYFKVIQRSTPSITSGIYVPDNPAGYELSSDLEAEMTLLRRPHYTTLLGFTNNDSVRRYARPNTNGHLTFYDGSPVPFNGESLSVMFVFDPIEALGVMHAIELNPGNSPKTVEYMTRNQYPDLKGLDKHAHEIEYTDQEGRFALIRSIHLAERMVRDYLQRNL